MVYGIGKNNMPKGWRRKTENNNRIYDLWHGMLRRCYDEKYHEKYPTYKDCYVCDRWLILYNFIEDLPKIDGYELWLNNPNKHISLDKDIKSNGNNKCYCLEQCVFVSNSDNTIQSNKTMNYDFTQKEEYRQKMNPKKVIQYDDSMNIIAIYNGIRKAERETGISRQTISTCCKFYEMNCNEKEWYKKYKMKPQIKAGGYIWKYYNGKC